MFLVFVFFCLGFVFVYFALFSFCCRNDFGVVLVFVLGGFFYFFLGGGGYFCLFLFVLHCLCWSVYVI